MKFFMYFTLFCRYKEDENYRELSSRNSSPEGGVAATFRLRQSTQAEACGHKIPPFIEG
jgi:hypothetical protein